MFPDFMRFMRHLWVILHFIRGIMAAFLVLLLLCAVVVAVSEKMPVGQAVYFVFITTLTIGYGDITPATALGRVASVAAGIIGLLFNGIIVAVTVRALSVSLKGRYPDQMAEHANRAAKRG